MSDTPRKRRRSPSPSLDAKRSIVVGVELKGFLLESKRILREFKHDGKKKNDETNYMLESAAEHLGENTVGAQELGLYGVVQLVSTLFEVAAAVTSLAPEMQTETQNGKIRLLHAHAMEGLRVVGGESFAEDDE